MSSDKIETLEKVQSWVNFNNIELDSDSKHFYLQGDSLDNFSKYLIANAQMSVLVSNPYVQRCSLSDSLIKTRKIEKTVLLLTRPVHPKDDYYREKMEYHESLKSSNVMIAYHKNIHAKIIIVDECVAIISSLNFTSSSSSGRAWEAGIVTISPKVVRTVIESVSSILESRDTVFQNPILQLRFEKSIERKPHLIFSYLTDPSLIPVWSSSIYRVERESTVPLQVGSVQNVHMKNSTVVRESYLTYSENEKFSTISRHKGITSIGKWELFPKDSSTLIQLIIGMVYPNPMNGFEFNVVKKVCEQYTEKLLNQLDQVLLSHVDI